MGLLPFCSIKIRTLRPKSTTYPVQLITLDDHIRKRRLDLGKEQKEIALTLGVTGSTITGWELNQTTPGIIHLPKIIAFLGFTLEPYCKETDNIIEQIKIYRQRQGLTQEKFAELVGVDETTIAKWEREDHKPMKFLSEKVLNILKF